MERIVIRETTRNPQLEVGEVLLALVRTLYNTNPPFFHARLTQCIEKYRDFLNEKTINPLTGESYWTHRELRKDTFSLMTFKKICFPLSMINRYRLNQIPLRDISLILMILLGTQRTL